MIGIFYKVCINMVNILIILYFLHIKYHFIVVVSHTSVRCQSSRIRVGMKIGQTC